MAGCSLMAVQTLSETAAKAPAFGLSPRQIQENLSFGYLFDRPQSRSVEAEYLSTFSNMVWDILRSAEGFSDLTSELLRRVRLKHDAVGLERVNRDAGCLIVVANHPGNGFIDGSLLYQSVIQLGFEASIVAAHNLDLGFDSVSVIPIAMPRWSARDTRSDLDIARVNASALAKIEMALQAGRAVGVFPGAGYYERSDDGRSLVEGNFDRLVPILKRTKHLRPKVIGIRHDYAIPQWWSDLYVEDAETFFASQWEAMLELGPQEVHCTQLFDVTVAEDSSLGDIQALCQGMRDRYVQQSGARTGRA